MTTNVLRLENERHLKPHRTNSSQSLDATQHKPRPPVESIEVASCSQPSPFKLNIWASETASTTWKNSAHTHHPTWLFLRPLAPCAAAGRLEHAGTMLPVFPQSLRGPRCPSRPQVRGAKMTDWCCALSPHNQAARSLNYHAVSSYHPLAVYLSQQQPKWSTSAVLLWLEVTLLLLSPRVVLVRLPLYLALPRATNHPLHLLYAFSVTQPTHPRCCPLLWCCVCACGRSLAGTANPAAAAAVVCGGSSGQAQQAGMQGSSHSRG